MSEPVSWFQRRRAAWWEPWQSERTGMGMSVPFDEDVAHAWGMKGARVTASSVHGLDCGSQFLPLRVSIVAGQVSLTLDRGVHETGGIELRDAASGERKGRLDGLPYIVIEKAAPTTFFDTPFVDSPARPKTNELALVGRSIEELTIAGNQTLAVGLLVASLAIRFSGRTWPQIKTTTVPAREARRLPPLRSVPCMS